MPGKFISATRVDFPLLFKLFFFFPMEWGSQRSLADGWAMGCCHSGGRQCSEGSGRFVGFCICL